VTVTRYSPTRTGVGPEACRRINLCSAAIPTKRAAGTVLDNDVTPPGPRCTGRIPTSGRVSDVPVLRPFHALRPVPAHAAAVAAPPYDVVDVAEARALATGRPDSFLHVTRPEIDLPDGTDPHSDAVHDRARAALAALVERGVLVRDEAPTLSVYRQQRAGSPLTGAGAIDQTGIAGLASVADYRAGRIAIHEHTRPDKEDDRAAHLAAVAAHDEPVLLMYPGRAEIDVLVASVVDRPPAIEFTDHDGITHSLWIVTESSELAGLEAAFATVPRLYVADGHHRSAAAARLHERPDAPDGETDAFPVVAFPTEQLTVLPYQRVVAGPLPVRFPACLEDHFKVQTTGPAGSAAPTDLARHEFAMYAGGHWYRLTSYPRTVDETHPIARLDVAVLQDTVLAPLFGITNPRTDARIAFVGGSRGAAELERLVDSGRYAVAFALCPTSPAEVMAVADAGLVMPPKSTWFDPKLASGLFVHPLR
jgi:uncharacterized protein (DUF1015 family)